MIDSFGLPVSGWARMARSACSACGSRGLRWMPLGDLAESVVGGYRRRVVELRDFLGSDADAWLCTYCGMFGAFGGDEALWI